MALAQRMEMRQGQALVMTPQLQQAIKLLQLSNLELQAFVDAELERNPLLEREEREDADPREPREPADQRERAADEGGLEAVDRSIESDAPPSAGGDLDTDYENVYDEARADRASEAPDSSGSLGDWSSVRGGGGSFEGEAGELEGRLTRPPTLREHLTDQLQLATADPVQRLIGAELADCVDDAGYFRGDLIETAGRLGAATDEVEAVLLLMQGFEPTGVMARDLAECLALQLAERNRLDPAMHALVAHLDLVAKREITRLTELCGVDAEDIADMIAELRTLTPKPGLGFGAGPVHAVVPDVFVRETREGGYTVELNSETLPRVLVNARYHAEVSGAARKREDKVYVAECFATANWLVKSLDQRARTILKVSAEIVRQQDGFFAHGVRHLRPLNLKTVADAIGMHESTVSRVTSNKYAATPRGLFELKYFFTAAIASASGGEAHSAEAVRHRIRELIEAETPRQVLSDDRLVELLRGEGIEIARRTVAKYREALRIPSSVERRRLKKAIA